jgi:uncharacterized protein YjbI with pentapeptide repeats
VEPAPLLGRRPAFDVDEGENWFRSAIAGQQLRDLTMPHLAFGRSGVEDTSFANSDLSQSLLNWSDFVRVSFAGADLHDSDLRCSDFDSCDFSGANLAACDLRCSDFSQCRFEGASLDGAVVTEEQLGELPLSAEQRRVVRVDTEDDAPGG